MSTINQAELLAELEELIEAIRTGPSPVIGYDRNGENQRAFDQGWNANANRLWNLAANIRNTINQAKEAA